MALLWNQLIISMGATTSACVKLEKWVTFAPPVILPWWFLGSPPYRLISRGNPGSLPGHHLLFFLFPRGNGPSFGTFILLRKRPQREYSGELGSQNDSKMEPELEPKRRGSTLTKHAPAWADRMSPPHGQPRFRSFFPRPEKRHQKVYIIPQISNF